MIINTERLPHANILTPAVRRLDLIVDFSKVDFIDSSGLGMLVSLFKLMNGKGDMALCSLNPGIMNMFTLTRMDRIFRIYPDKSSALAQLGQ